MKLFLCFLSKSEILFFSDRSVFGVNVKTGQRNNLRDFIFKHIISAKIESHFTLNYAAHVNQDVNRKSIYVSCFSWNPL